MNYARLSLLSGLMLYLPLWAGYAPIPEQEQGKAWSVSLRTSAVHDSNIFGAPSKEISSEVYSASPKIAFNASVTDQTFVTASYQPTLDYFTDRPGSQSLFSHEVLGRVAHAFSPTTTLDLMDYFQISKNPESLLPGVAGSNPTLLNTDQSFQRNQFDASYSTKVTAKTGTTVKMRSTVYRFDNATLGQSLDRTENLYGFAGSYDVLPETKGVAEYRYETIDYRSAGANKDKTSNFLLGGVDYKAAEKLTASARLGVEWRHRDGERSQTAPSAELSLKYDYAQQSFLTAGYAYTLDESSDVANYTDTKVNRFFLNLQHALTPLIVASGSVDYEPSVLQGRRGINNANETTLRFGAALSYLPTKNWTLSATYDYDRVTSDVAAREMGRGRMGVSAAYAF
ncbi:MAG TPA: outer membrane beta-barrel protein [Opitutaceae bacterium]|nr:outer membrane beta-barrel protein [Opitutaceae bacterium]